VEGRKQVIIVGLGNPGKEYVMTRHNIGFMVLQTLASKMGISLKENKRFGAAFGKGSYKGVSCHLVMPLTYMNLSGQAVRQVVDYYKLDADDVIVVVDDVALPFGAMRLRDKGSAGGHNGLKSIEQHLGTREYVRLRMGIGEKVRGDLTDHVLGQFSASERQKLPAFVELGVAATLRLLQEDPDQVMQDVNTKIKTNDQQPREARQEKSNETE